MSQENDEDLTEVDRILRDITLRVRLKRKGTTVASILDDEDDNGKKLPSTFRHPLHAVFPRETRVGTAITWWAAGAYAYNTGKSFKIWVENQKKKQDKYTIRISSLDEEELYSLVFNWIIQNTDDEPVNDFDLVTVYTKNRYSVLKVSNTEKSFPMVIGGVEVKVRLDETQTKDGSAYQIRRDLTIKCRNQGDTDKIYAFIAEIYRFSNYGFEDTILTPRLQYATYSGNGGWAFKKFIARDKDSVILKGSLKEDLFADIEKFRSDKSEYLRVHIPWHRGYLFFGSAGTGKTSLALAVASSFNLPVYFLPLTNVSDDKDLMKAINNMEHSEAVLILEDVDVATATHDRLNKEEKKVGGATLAGLLNILDGVGTPSGLVTIMTTNSIDELDSALIRPGRVDMRLLIDMIDNDQLERLVLWYLDREVKDFPLIKADISPAEITGIVKFHMGDPDLCVEEIRRFIEKSNYDV